MRDQLQDKLLEWTREKNADLLVALDDLREISLEGMKVNTCEFNSIESARNYLHEKMQLIYSTADSAITEAVNKSTTERVANAINFIDKFIGDAKKSHPNETRETGGDGEETQPGAETSLEVS